MRLGALILTGGASSRMGADKAALDWNGARAVDRAAGLARAFGADPILTVGARNYGFASVAEEPPGGGPAAGVIAGARRLAAEGCARALVLAVDAPTIEPGDLAPLLAAPAPGAAFAHLHLPLLLDTDFLPTGSAAGWSLARLITEASLALLRPPAGGELRLRGANTPEERHALLAALVAAEGARKQSGG